MSDLTRRATLSGLLGVMGQAAFAVTGTPPKARPEAGPSLPSGTELIAGRQISGKTAFAIGQSGGLLESNLSTQKLPPASVAKIFTALYALETLGPERRLLTRLMGTGPIQEGVLQGDLILAGGGDPTLNSDGLADMAQALRAKGVRAITGQFYVYEGALPKIAQIDTQQTVYAGYNPTISGLILNFNRVHFDWKVRNGAYVFKLDARTEKRQPVVSSVEVKIAERQTPVFDHRLAQGTEQWRVARPALGNGGARWLPVHSPALYAGDVMRTVAAEAGVRLPKAEVITALPEVTELARVQSAPVKELVQGMLKFSTNITAEALGLTASRARGGVPKTLRASAGAMSTWAKGRYGLMHTGLIDHSGLGGASRTSAADLVKLLSEPSVKAALLPLLKPVKMKGHETGFGVGDGVDAVAKTGTLDFVSSLAGYVAGPSGQTRPFAILSADLPARAKAKQSGKEVPVGARTFKSRGRNVQRDLLLRWVRAYSL